MNFHRIVNFCNPREFSQGCENFASLPLDAWASSCAQPFSSSKPYHFSPIDETSKVYAHSWLLNTTAFLRLFTFPIPLYISPPPPPPPPVHFISSPPTTHDLPQPSPISTMARTHGGHSSSFRPRVRSSPHVIDRAATTPVVAAPTSVQSEAPQLFLLLFQPHTDMR